MIGPTNPDAVQRNAKDITASANADAVIAIAADAQHHWVIDTVHCSYKLGSATTGMLTIAIGGTTLHQVDIVANGVYEFIFEHGLYKTAETKNEQAVITLAAGGTSVVGKVNCTYR